jgi:tetratricopeptide (TPR) repeat protein
MACLIGGANGAFAVTSHDVDKWFAECSTADLNACDKIIAVIEAGQLGDQPGAFMQMYNARGIANHEIGQFGRAISDYDSAIEILPHPVPFQNRGKTKVVMQSYEAAIEDFDAALEMNPQYVSAYINRGVANAGLVQYAQAMNDYNQALSLSPDEPLAFGNRGNAHAFLGDHEAAIRDYTKALEIDPNYLSARFNRGLAHYATKTYDLAIVDFEAALKLNSSNPTYWFAKSWTLHLANRQAEALVDAEQAARLAPDNDSFVLNYGFMLIQNNKWDEGYEQYARSIEIGGRERARFFQEKMAALDYFDGNIDSNNIEETLTALRACLNARCRIENETLDATPGQ